LIDSPPGIVKSTIAFCSMNKTIRFVLNDFPCVPHRLRKIAAIDAATDTFVVDLARLYHHYFVDNFDAKTTLLHSNFEYLNQLSETRDFRFLDNSIGRNKYKKRSISSELGQASCRYFLYEFCSVN
jgi:hypothetical protein